jgi:hypothetical protein
MAHLGQKQLSKIVTEAQTKVSVGAKYHHYKDTDQQYEVLAIALDEDTQKPCIVYKALYGKEIVWMRTLENFLEEVETDQGKICRFNLS